MRAQELRIGNWIYSTILGEPVPILVCGIMENGVRVSPTESRPIYTLAPIPLTEELLLKCGFNKFAGRECFYYAKYNLYEKSHLNGFAIEERGNGFYLLSKIEYQVGEQFNNLHQLQNLYFALTGEELDVEL